MDRTNGPETGHKVGRSRVMSASDWDERYAEGRQWSVEPNRFFAQVVEDLADQGLSGGTAIDLACGEGRNAAWLAERGWNVTGADFSSVAIERGRAGASKRATAVDWQVVDLQSWDLGTRAWDLVAHVYLHWGSSERDPFLERCAASVADGGAIVVIGHDRSNIEDGHGGPQDPDLLTTPDELDHVFGRAGLDVTRAEPVYRDVTVKTEDGAEATARAIDHVVVARRR